MLSSRYYPQIRCSASQPTSSTSFQPPSPHLPTYKIRHARAPDVEQCAAICVQAFPDNNPSVLFARPRTLEQWSSQLASALDMKIVAGRDNRAYRLTQGTEQVKLERAALRGEKIRKADVSLKKHKWTEASR